MPELPEVETIRRQLAPLIQGRVVEGLEIADPRWCLPLAPEAIVAAPTGDPSVAQAAYRRLVEAELIPDHKMSMLLIRALQHRKGARAAVRVAGATDWTRRNFARWLFEDEPRGVLLTPRRWHRQFLSRPGSY